MSNEEFQELVINRFDEVNKQFDEVNKRLDRLAKEQNQTTKQMIKLERRLEEIHGTALEAWALATENRITLEKANLVFLIFHKIIS